MSNKKITSIVTTVFIVIAALVGASIFNSKGAVQQNNTEPTAIVQEVGNTSQIEISDQDALKLAESTVEESGRYVSKYEVAAYIHKYNHLPENYITKRQAKKSGWKQNGNEALSDALPGRIIGGGGFGNKEGLLPDEDGRKYYECDVNYTSGPRGDDRLVYSNDGLVFFSTDHYETFEQLY